jgi:hypothetical protein
MLHISSCEALKLKVHVQSGEALKLKVCTQSSKALNASKLLHSPTLYAIFAKKSIFFKLTIRNKRVFHP